MTAEAPGRPARDALELAIWRVFPFPKVDAGPKHREAVSNALSAVDDYVQAIAAEEREPQPAPELAAAVYRLACGCPIANGKNPLGNWTCAVHGPTTMVGESAGQPAPELAAAMTALEDIAHAAQGYADSTGAIDHNWLVETAMRGLGWLPASEDEPQPAAEPGTAWRLLDEARAATDQLRDRLATLAASLDSAALDTRPSKKSQIQADAARRIREALA